MTVKNAAKTVQENLCESSLAELCTACRDEARRNHSVIVTALAVGDLLHIIHNRIRDRAVQTSEIDGLSHDLDALLSALKEDGFNNETRVRDELERVAHLIS